MSGKGSTHARWMHLTSIATLVLTAIVTGFAISLTGHDHATAAALLSSPLFAIPLLLFVVIGGFHMYLGMRVIIDDYVHETAARRVAHFFNCAFSLVIVVLGALALARLALGVF